MNIGLAIKESRKKAKIKQMDLAKMSGISQTYLSLIEKGRKHANISVLIEISKALNIPISILFWYSMDETDVCETKKEVFRSLKKPIDDLIYHLY